MIEVKDEMCRNHGVVTNGCTNCGANTEDADVKEIRIMPDHGGSGVAVTLCKSCRKALHDLLAKDDDTNPLIKGHVIIGKNKNIIALGSPGVGMSFYEKKELLSKFVTSEFDGDVKVIVTDPKQEVSGCACTDVVMKLKAKYSSIDIVNRETGEYGCIHCRTAFNNNDLGFAATGLCPYCYTSLE